MGKLFRDQTAKEQNAILTAILHKMGGTLTPSSAEEIVAAIRNGTIGVYLQPGDPLTVAKENGVSTTISGSITGANVTEETFIETIGRSDAGAYEFVFDGAAWKLDGSVVELSNYGISVTGTPAEGDAIVVHVSASAIAFEMLGEGKDVPVNQNLKNSISLLTRDVQTYGSIARCAPQALVSIVEAIPSGTTVYVVGNHCCYDGTTKQDGNFGFVAPVDIPAGAKIKHSTLGQYQSSAANYTKAAILAGTFSIYDASYAELAKDIATVETSSGTLLGTVTASDPQYLANGTAHVNFTQRNMYGSNRAAHAAHGKWLNSDAAGAASGAIASWWTASDEFDMPVRSTLPGWLHGIDPEFRTHIVPVFKRTAKSIADGYGYEDTQELIWVPSMTEIGFGNNNSVVETSPKSIGGDPNWTGAYPLYDGASNADRIKYENTTARYWFLRSPYPSSASSVRSVNADGSLSNFSIANVTYGAVAGLSLA